LIGCNRFDSHYCISLTDLQFLYKTEAQFSKTRMNSQQSGDEPLGPLNDRFKFFLANMDFNTTPSQIKSFFSSFGIVNYVKIILKKTHPTNASITTTTTSRSKGYGFLYMFDESGDAAVEKFAKENRHRIVLMGKERVFLSRHDDSRAQPIRNPMKAFMGQSHDWSLNQVAPSTIPNQNLVVLPSSNYPPPAYQGWNHQDPLSGANHLSVNVISQNVGPHLTDRSPNYSNGHPLFPYPPHIQGPSESYAPNALYGASTESNTSVSHPHTSHMFSMSSAPPSVTYGSNFQESSHSIHPNLSGVPNDFSLTHQQVSEFFTAPSHVSNGGYSNNSIPSTHMPYSNGGYSSAQTLVPQTYAHSLPNMPHIHQNVASTSFSSYISQGGPGPTLTYLEQHAFDASSSQMYNPSAMHMGATSLTLPPHTHFHSSSSFVGRGNRGRGGRTAGRGRGGGGTRDTRHRNRDRPY
jgi:hypothetical protein